MFVLFTLLKLQEEYHAGQIKRNQSVDFAAYSGK